MEVQMKKRCISAYVENQIGVLAKISGLFAGKNYNLDTLTELLFIKVNSCKEADKQEIFRIAQTFDLLVVDYNRKSVLVQCVKTVSKNNDMIALFKDMFVNRIEVVRGGSVAIEALSTPDR